MASSIRAELKIDNASNCPIAKASDSLAEPITDISRSIVSDHKNRQIEEFSTSAGTTIESAQINTVFEDESRSVHRFQREKGTGCVCEIIEQNESPIADIKAEHGGLTVTFYVADFTEIQNIVGELREVYDSVQIIRLLQTEESTPSDFVAVDRNNLTARQREVLETSYEMGYFDHPKQSNAGEVAEALGITTSTFSEHLAAAQRKLLEPILTQ